MAVECVVMIYFVYHLTDAARMAHPTVAHLRTKPHYRCRYSRYPQPGAASCAVPCKQIYKFFLRLFLFICFTVSFLRLASCVDILWPWTGPYPSLLSWCVCYWEVRGVCNAHFVLQILFRNFVLNYMSKASAGIDLFIHLLQQILIREIPICMINLKLMKIFQIFRIIRTHHMG